MRPLIAAAARTLLWFGAAGLYWVVHSGGDPQLITVEKINFGMRLPRLPNDPSLSFSAGVAAFKGADEPLPALMDRADRAMYRAKQAGRAQVVCAQQE